MGKSGAWGLEFVYSFNNPLKKMSLGRGVNSILITILRFRPSYRENHLKKMSKTDLPL